MKRLIIPAGALFLGGAISVLAANLAADDASDAVYIGPPLQWISGQNGGYGFGPWSFQSRSPAGSFVWTSTGNADGLDDGNVNGAANDGDIDTGAITPVSWGLWANNGGNIRAERFFTGTPQSLEPGQIFQVDFDTGYIEPNSLVAVGLINASGTEVFSVGFTGGGANYWFMDANNSTPANTGLGYGSEGLRLIYTVDSVNPLLYSVQLTRRDNTSVSWNGAISSAAAGFFAINFNAGGTIGGSAYDFFINSMQIVPEPSTIALAALGAFGLLFRRFGRKF